MRIWCARHLCRPGRGQPVQQLLRIEGKFSVGCVEPSFARADEVFLVEFTVVSTAGRQCDYAPSRYSERRLPRLEKAMVKNGIDPD